MDGGRNFLVFSNFPTDCLPLNHTRSMASSSGAEIQELYTSARKLALATSATIGHLERAGQQPINPATTETRFQTAQAQLDQLQRLCQDLEGRHAMWQSSGSTRDSLVWQKKVQQLVEESAALQRSLEACRVASARVGQEEAQRQELLQRRKHMSGRTTNGAIGIDVETADLEAKERIRRSKQVAEEAYQTGVATLTAMAGQRDVLKNAHRKVLDVLNTVGMSDSVLRIAERRIAMDKLIAYGGMLLVCGLIVFWLVVYAK